MLERDRAEIDSARRRAAYAKSRDPRAIWSRNSTAVWLTDRSEPVLAWLRRGGHAAPTAACRRLGVWLKENQPSVFSHVHQKLAAARTDAERATMHVGDVIP